MRWQGRRESDNVEDRRGMPVGKLAAGGGLGTIVVVIVAMLLGGDPRALLQQMQPPGGQPAAGRRQSPVADQPLEEMVSVVLADTEDVWRKLFQENRRKYRDPKLVLFSGEVKSACGFASAATGPFYCPGDEKVYLDLSFCEELRTRFKAPGDFAVAYVLAHEVGHHVQQQLGYTEHVDKQRGRISKAAQNRLSVRLELQADFLAGVWAYHAEKMKALLEPGDVEEALQAAGAVGDDRLQMQTQGYVVPDSFRHGTSAQRARWFRLGLETGDLRRAKELFDMPEERL